MHACVSPARGELEVSRLIHCFAGICALPSVHQHCAVWRRQNLFTTRARDSDITESGQVQ